ncbi:F-box/LRR-repeat protein 4-like [Agrilus planipennis]|uniref:F-box/LRR-repeat protein 4-like n=1 Tax=Agrilus planipennis TaxID=224129 RepID=A0A1W4WT00_AGRPL|nr:F-box/LRR-repeat protein 4-like [Agrilus planipennis]
MANFLDLPYEILSYIVTFLSYADRSALKLTCKILYDVCIQNFFIKEEILHVQDAVVSAEHDPLVKIGRNTRIHKKLVFTNVDFKYDSEFWINYGNSIEALAFINSDISSDCLFNILSNCSSLESIKLEKLTHLFMTFRPNRHRIILPNLKSFELCSSKYITDKIFSYFLSMCPSLNHLSIHDCENFCHPGIYKKFYPKNGDEMKRPSDAIFSFLYIKYAVSVEAAYLTSLDFSKTMINGEYLLSILEIENLTLSNLNISGCSQLRISSYKTISQLQPNLKCVLLNDVRGGCMEILKNPMKNLTVLEMDGIQKTIEVSEAAGNSLRNLKELSMNKCDPMAAKTVLEIMYLNQPSIQKISFASIELPREILLNIIQSFKKLVCLNLSNIVVAVDDAVLRCICENLTLLRELDLTNCDEITDRGLMGIDLNSESSVRPKKQLLMRIPLGSKVETEIREDVARKREIMQIMNISGQPTTFSIMRLQGLKVLSLRNCTRVSDLSLKSVFKFVELISLDIAGCQQITHEGFSEMIPNVKSLEVLNLSSCFNIGDKTVDNICQGLKRLKILILQNCKQLTDKSLESVFYSTSLKRINVKGCENMNNDFIRSIEDVLEQRRVFTM